MVNKTFRRKRFISLLLQVQFYTILTGWVAYQLGIFSLSGIKSWFLFFFPIITDRYWFVTVYVLIYILIPFINTFLNHLSKEQWQKFLGVMFLTWCVIPTIFGVFQNTTEGMLYYNRFLWYIVMYCLGAYCRRFDFILLQRQSYCALIIVASYVVIISSIILITMYPAFFAKVGIKEPAYFWPPNSIPLVTLSLATFCWFVQLKIKPNRVINKFASTTLAVYMLHDGVLNKWLWGTVFHNAAYQESPFLLLHILSTAMAIFLLASLLDFIRQQLEVWFWKGFDWLKSECL